MGDFRKLEVWQVAHKVACEVYRETATFPKTEAYGLTAQYDALPLPSPQTSQRVVAVEAMRSSAALCGSA